MSLEPFFKDRHRAGGRGRGRDKGGEKREDIFPVGFGPVRGRVRGTKLRRAKRNYQRDMIRACGWKGGIPLVEGGRQQGVGEGKVEDRGPGRMREGEVGIYSRLIEEGKLVFRGEGEVRMRDTQLTGVKDPEGVRGGVVDVKVT